MATNQATKTDVQHLLGDVDPLIAERIAELGPTPDEIAEALRGIEDERGFGEQSHEPSSEKVAEIRALLWDTFDEPDDEYEH